MKLGGQELDETGKSESPFQILRFRFLFISAFSPKVFPTDLARSRDRDII